MQSVLKLESVSIYIPPIINEAYSSLVSTDMTQFLFSPETTEPLGEPVKLVAEEYKTTPDIVMEESRRFIALKVFLCDVDGKR